MEVKIVKSIAIATVEQFLQSDTKICRALDGLNKKGKSTASNKLTVALAMLSLVFIVSFPFLFNRIV